MKDTQLNSAESIALIHRMIETTRERYEKGTGTTFLVFGYTSFFVGGLVSLLVHLTANYYFALLWWLIPIISYGIIYYINRNKTKEVATHIDTFIDNMWRVLAVFLIAFPVIGMFSPLVNNAIIPFESLLLSIGILVTGVTIRVWPVTLSGIIAGVLSSFMFFISTGYEYVFMAMFLLGMIIPGHILNYRARCSKS